MVWLPLSASAAVGAAVGAEFPVFPVVVESENTRVQIQAMALNGIIAKNTHRIKPLNSFLSKSIELNLKGPESPGCHTTPHHTPRKKTKKEPGPDSVVRHTP